MTFQILSLSGGGFLGLYTIALLDKIEQRAGKPIAQCFDLLAGTSIGGIIALGLAAGTPASKILKAFEENGEKIFPSKKPNLFKKLRHPKYSDLPLRETIEAIVGAELLMGDLKHPVIIPSLNLTRGKAQFFKTPHHPDFKTDLHLKVVDVALATSAAPTYFPLAQVNNQLYADGGLYVNAPDLAALHEAEHFFRVSPESVRMLSIGTTTTKFTISHDVGRKLGIAGWGKDQRIIRAMMASQQLYVQDIVGHKLGKNYVRIDTEQSTEQQKYLALDIATENAQGTIKGLAESAYQQEVNNNRLQKIIEYQAPDTVFYNHLTDNLAKIG